MVLCVCVYFNNVCASCTFRLYQGLIRWERSISEALAAQLVTALHEQRGGREFKSHPKPQFFILVFFIFSSFDFIFAVHTMINHLYSLSSHSFIMAHRLLFVNTVLCFII